MDAANTDPAPDIWSQWLLLHRHGEDPEYSQAFRRIVDGYVDRLLDAAEPRAGMTLLDIGTGDGVVAFRAIERAGAQLRVILSDISKPLLAQAERNAQQRGVWQQCRFMQCSAEQLTGIEDASVDIVSSRAALAYVADKRQALREALRVLRPGGRLSIAEPILQDDAFYVMALRTHLAAQPAGRADPFMQLMYRWKAAQYPDTDAAIRGSPLVNFNERDLVRVASEVGFVDLHLQLHVSMTAATRTSWDTFLASSPHPQAPSLALILEQQFSASERELFVRTLRPLVEDGGSQTVERIAYLVAAKPD